MDKIPFDLAAPDTTDSGLTITVVVPETIAEKRKRSIRNVIALVQSGKLKIHQTTAKYHDNNS